MINFVSYLLYNCALTVHIAKIRFHKLLNSDTIFGGALLVIGMLRRRGRVFEVRDADFVVL